VAEARRLFDIQLDLLGAEVAQISAAIRRLEALTASIKIWALVAWAVSVGFTLMEVALHEFVWMTALIPLTLWLVDGSYRSRMRTYMGREREIADYVNSPTFRGAAEGGLPLHFPLLLMRRRPPGFEYSRVAALLHLPALILYATLALCSVAIWGGVTFERRATQTSGVGIEVPAAPAPPAPGRARSG
jgi:hypothetical protein